MTTKHFVIPIDGYAASPLGHLNQAMGSPIKASPRRTTAGAARSGGLPPLFFVSVETSTLRTTKVTEKKITIAGIAKPGSRLESHAHTIESDSPVFLASAIRRACRRLAHAKRLRQSAERVLAAAAAGRETQRRGGLGSRGAH
jgi:hypothetical protein